MTPWCIDTLWNWKTILRTFTHTGRHIFLFRCAESPLLSFFKLFQKMFFWYSIVSIHFKKERVWHFPRLISGIWVIQTPLLRFYNCWENCLSYERFTPYKENLRNSLVHRPSVTEMLKISNRKPVVSTSVCIPIESKFCGQPKVVVWPAQAKKFVSIISHHVTDY